MSVAVRRAVLGALFCALSCSKSELSPPRSGSSQSPAAARRAASTDPTDEDYQMPQLPRAKVTVRDVYGGAHAFDAEIAESEESQTRGLMWRKELPSDKAMLFIFSNEQVRSFWMRNTLIPLDMIFISADKTIAGIVANAAPQTLSSRSVAAPSKYVLEVAGGFCEKAGVRAGSRVEIEKR